MESAGIKNIWVLNILLSLSQTRQILWNKMILATLKLKGEIRGTLFIEGSRCGVVYAQHSQE